MHIFETSSWTAISKGKPGQICRAGEQNLKADRSIRNPENCYDRWPPWVRGYGPELWHYHVGQTEGKEWHPFLQDES